jgi:hypothetical protein
LLNEFQETGKENKKASSSILKRQSQGKDKTKYHYQYQKGVYVISV